MDKIDELKDCLKTLDTCIKMPFITNKYEELLRKKRDIINEAIEKSLKCFHSSDPYLQGFQ